jgi:hypothetical protein
MYSRYDFLENVYDVKYNEFRKETFPPIKAEDIISDRDIIVSWNSAERIDKIAAKYYGDGSYWWIICLANDLISPLQKIEDGTSIRIPSSVELVIEKIKLKRG